MYHGVIHLLSLFIKHKARDYTRDSDKKGILGYCQNFV